MNQFVQFCKKHQLILIATIVGLIAASIYYFSGKSGLENSTRQLTSTDQSVEKVEIKEAAGGQKTAEIKCQNGESYEVYYPPGETDYRSIAASKCGE